MKKELPAPCASKHDRLAIVRGLSFDIAAAMTAHTSMGGPWPAFFLPLCFSLRGMIAYHAIYGHGTRKVGNRID